MSKRLTVALVLLVAASGCQRMAHRFMTVASTPRVTEGDWTQVTVTVRNPEEVPIVPLSLTLYARPDPTEYFAARRVLGETDFYEPLQATEVHHLPTLNRVEATHIRDRGKWRRVPDSRFLHPRILLPGKTLSETFSFQALEPYSRLVYCELVYLTFRSERVRGHLFKRKPTKPTSPETERYTETYERVDETRLDDPDPQPADYLLFRPRGYQPDLPLTLRRRVPLNVQPRPFSYRQAAARARFGASQTCFFPPNGTWVFEYPDDGTWFIGPDMTIKLRGHYGTLVTNLVRRGAKTLELPPPAAEAATLTQYLTAAGYLKQGQEGRPPVVAIPVPNLLTVLEKVEALGWTPAAGTWEPIAPATLKR